jgi:hypothetical protein
MCCLRAKHFALWQCRTRRSLRQSGALNCFSLAFPGKHLSFPINFCRLRSHNMRWFDFLAAFIFIGVTVLLLGGTAMSVRQRTADIYMAEAQLREAAQRSQ